MRANGFSRISLSMDPQPANVRARCVILNWLLGLLLATLAIWGIGAVLLSDVMVWQFDDVTGRWLPAPDRPYTYTREGWGTTTWQTHARLAERLPADNEPTVVFWGDSYVEALQLDDREKMFNVFSRLADQRGSDLRGIGVALSGWDLDDYYDLLPKLKGRLGKPRVHLFVVHIKDILASSIAFPDAPMPSDIEADHRPRFLTLRPWFYRLDLSAFWALPRDAAETVRNLRLAPGPVPQAPDADPGWVEFFRPPDWTTFDPRLFTTLQGRADAPIAFVLLPYNYPKIPPLPGTHERLRWEDAWFYKPFVEACRRHGVPCIDMAGPFDEFYERTGRFPRGFVNTIPGEGHLNADGHRLVAQAVANWLAKGGASE